MVSVDLFAIIELILWCLTKRGTRFARNASGLSGDLMPTLGDCMILALDFGSTTGWAIGPESGTWDIKPRRGESPGMRYIRLRGELNAILRAYPELKLVAYEQAHHRGGAATEYAVGCATHLQSWCAEHGIEHTTVHSATIKKFITGGGKASKDEVIAAVREKGYRPRDDNEADAIAMWLYMEAA